MKYDEEKSSPSWHPYRYQVTDSSVMKSKQIFFTLSPDGLTQFALDNTTFIDLNRSDNYLSLPPLNILPKVDQRCRTSREDCKNSNFCKISEMEIF